MAYYKVTQGGESYVNQHLCQVANKLGPTGVARAVSEGTFKQVQFFDNILYSADKSQWAVYKPFDEQIQKQNVDARVAKIKPIDPSESTYKTLVVPKAHKPKLFNYGGVEFIRFGDVPDSNKYNLQPRIATVHVCGSIFVALNAKNESETNPVIVTIKD